MPWIALQGPAAWSLALLLLLLLLLDQPRLHWCWLLLLLLGPQLACTGLLLRPPAALPCSAAVRWPADAAACMHNQDIDSQAHPDFLLLKVQSSQQEAYFTASQTYISNAVTCNLQQVTFTQ
jgi:hypothetical protein